MTVRKQRETQNLYTGSSDALSFPLTRDLSHTLGDGRGETLFSQGFSNNPEAAYSLRALGSYNNPVLRVRREPHDTDATINDERTFTAPQVSGGELENWVNGKLETTLPVDIDSDNCAGAYSLRKVKDGYSGNAVRIRRTAENREVDVAFDSDGKVSLDSLVTNVTESPDAGNVTEGITLKNFLENRQQNFNPTPIGDIGSVFNQWTSLTATKTSFSATTGDVDSNNSRYTYQLNAPHTASDSEITTYRVKGTISYSSASGEKLIIKPTTGIDGGSSFNQSNVTVTGVAQIGSSGLPFFDHGASGDFDIRFTGNGTHQLRSIAFLQTEMTGTSSVSITNLDISIYRSGATVHTWYDQAGSNDAVQETAANQPKIAENGALILDDNNLPVIDDLGNGKFLEFTNFIYDSSDTSYSFFIKIDKQSQTTGNYWLLGDSETGSSRNGGADRGLKVQLDRIVHYFQPYEGDQNFNHGYRDWVKNSVLSFIAKSDNVTYQLFNNAVQLGSDSTKSSNRYSPIKRIMQASDSNTTNDFQGTLSELIFYDTDQSSNRFKIESNINNYYGLYNDAKELTEDFEGGSVSTSSVGGQTFVANGKDGFTVTTSSSATGEGGFTTVANEFAYKISFNAKLNGNTVNIARRINKHGSGAATQLQALTEGFNTYDYASAGSGNYQALTFTCSDDNATFTISDFKISAIARNGFVETWYDQSGNGRHMTQTTAADQPHIVENGGICKDPTANPSVRFVNVATNLGSTFLKNTTNTPSANTVMSAYFVASIETNIPNRQTFTGATQDLCLSSIEQLQFRRGGNNRSFNDLRMFQGNNNLATFSTDSSLVPTCRLNGTSQTQVAFTGGAGESTFQILGENSTGAGNDTFGLQGTISEAILFNDIEYDSRIESNLSTYYNITLS